MSEIAFKSQLMIYTFTVRHPETNEIKYVQHPASSYQNAKTVLVLKCGKAILNRVVDVTARKMGA